MAKATETGNVVIEMPKEEWEKLISVIGALSEDPNYPFVKNAQEAVKERQDVYAECQEELHYIGDREFITDAALNCDFTTAEAKEYMKKMNAVVERQEERIKRLEEALQKGIATKAKEKAQDIMGDISDTCTKFVNKTEAEIKGFMADTARSAQEICDRAVKFSRDINQARADKKALEYARYNMESAKRNTSWIQKRTSFIGKKHELELQLKSGVLEASRRASLVKTGFKNLGRALRGKEPLNETVENKFAKSLCDVMDKQIEKDKANLEMLKEEEGKARDGQTQAYKKFQGLALEAFRNGDRSHDVCLAAVTDNFANLELINAEHQDNDICIAAVQQNPWALEYVADQTPELCKKAVSMSPVTLDIIEEQTYDICKMAAELDPKAAQYIHDPEMKEEILTEIEADKSLEEVIDDCKEEAREQGSDGHEDKEREPER